VTSCPKWQNDIIRRMREFWNLFSTFAAVAALTMLFVPPAPLNGQEKGKAVPKNLKVLTPENFMDQMQTFAAALGVESQGGCNFCHEADRSLDTKPEKVKAREAIELVAEINKKLGGDKVHVTCWTCHHGSIIPETTRNGR